MSGTQLYTKPADGLLSGVVGTTLFDTVKSAVAYSSLLEAHDHNPSLLLNVEHVTKWLLENHGLVVKEGTWDPEPLDLGVAPCGMRRDGSLEAPELSLFGSGKFLGVQYVYVAGPQRPEWMPYLPDGDWVSAILAPRDSAIGEKKSTTALHRLAFDRIRGYLVTGAIFSAEVRSALHYWLDRIPGEAILMQPQGTTPPEGVLLGHESEWEYPTPEFIPSVHWVWDIYASEGNLYGAGPIQVFADFVLEQISEMRAQDRRIKISMRGGVTKVTPYEDETPELPRILPQSTKETNPKLTTAWKGETPVTAKDPRQRIALRETGAVPRDLLKPHQTDTEAVAYDVKARPKDQLLHQLVKDDNLKPLSFYATAVDGGPVSIPGVMVAKEQGNPIVHPPTKEGLLPPIVTPHDTPVLMDDNLPDLKVLADLPPLPAAAVERILALEGFQYKWKTHVESKLIERAGVRTSVQVVYAQMQLVKLTPVGAGAVMTKSPPFTAQLWKGRSLAAIKAAFWALVLSRNKAKLEPMAAKKTARDWSFPADRSKVPYSEFDGIEPPYAAKNPLNPRPVFIENRAGVVEILPTIAPVEIPPVEEGPVVMDQVPLVESSVYVAEYKGPVLPPRAPKEDVKRWWEHSSDEEEWKAGGYVNAEYHPKTRRFLPLPGPPPEVDRSTKRGVRRREKVAAEKAESSGQTSTSSDEKENTQPKQPPVFEPLPAEPKGGWPLYLYGRWNHLSVHDKALRKEFTTRHGRLPPGVRAKSRAQERRDREEAAKQKRSEPKGKDERESERRTSRGPQGGPGPKTPFRNLSTQAIERELSRRRNAEKKAEENRRSEGRSGSSSEEDAKPKTTYTTRPYECPRFNGGKRTRRPRAGNTGARN